MNLVQIALAAEKLMQDTAPISTESATCLHRWNKNAACNICVDTCPVGAIQREGSSVQIDPEACVRCGLCLHTCPTGVFNGRNSTYRLLYCVEQLIDRETIELACSLHPKPGLGERGTDAVVVVNGCLAALGSSAYVGLTALGVRQIRTRLDACAACPLSALETSIRDTLSESSQLPGMEDHLFAIDTNEGKHKRPIYSTKNPPLSRRGFFQKLSRPRGTAAADIAPPDPPQIESQRHPPQERRWLLNALRAVSPLDASVTNDGFTRLTITSDCTACGLCARVCPTDALQFSKDEQHFEISVIPGDCINCGLCTSYCQTNALHHAGYPTVQELVEPTPQELFTGQLHRCWKCGAPFAGDSANGLCAVCTFRSDHPFSGTNMMPRQPH